MVAFNNNNKKISSLFVETVNKVKINVGMHIFLYACDIFWCGLLFGFPPLPDEAFH